jgi:Transcriptional regulatory protein, C terminal
MENRDVAAAYTFTGGSLRFADLALDRRTRLVTRGLRRLELTPIEFALLDFLLENAETVLARSLILERVWGFDFGPTSNSLNVYIGYLRRKTEADGEPRLIHTVRGIGYVPGRSPGPDALLRREPGELRARHVDGRAAVDHERRRIDVRGLVRCEEEHGVGHILRRAEPRHRVIHE